MVPLLELDDGSLVTESVPVAKRIATEFTEHAQLLPPADTPAVNAFIDHWIGVVEPAYYEVLKADSEPQARFKTTGLLDALAKVEDQLWAGRMRDTG